MPIAPANSRVAILGASPRENRYSFKAFTLLKEHGFVPVPVHPAGHVVGGVAAAKSLDEVTGQIDTLTVYVNATLSDKEAERILRLKPRRVIFNPGAENESLGQRLEEAGIEVVRSCTLVMLRSDRF